MECPFALPVRKLSDLSSAIIDKRGIYVALAEHLEYADYIVQAINSHEKFQDKLFEVARQAIAKYDINAPPLTKNRFANELVDSLEQALE